MQTEWWKNKNWMKTGKKSTNESYEILKFHRFSQHILQSIAMNMQDSELMMSLPHNLILRSFCIWKIDKNLSLFSCETVREC